MGTSSQTPCSASSRVIYASHISSPPSTSSLYTADTVYSGRTPPSTRSPRPPYPPHPPKLRSLLIVLHHRQRNPKGRNLTDNRIQGVLEQGAQVVVALVED